MAQFSLPQNSKIEVGQYFKDKTNSKNLKKAVKMSKGFYETEASGEITLKNVNSVSSTGVDRISVGSLTHSLNALDLKLEI